MHDVCILFGYYHKKPGLTLKHYELIVANNPGIPVVPLVCESEPYIINTIDVGQLWNPWIKQEETPVYKNDVPLQRYSWLWMYSDRVKYYRYLRQPWAVKAKRYIIFEWDFLAYKMGVKEAYKEVWDADCAGAGLIQYAPGVNWAWWSDLPNKIPHKYIVGIPPFGGVMLSDRAVDCLIQTNHHEAMYSIACECYTPTVLTMNGLKVVRNPQTEGKNAPYGSLGGLAGIVASNGEPGYYHPVTEESSYHDSAI